MPFWREIPLIWWYSILGDPCLIARHFKGSNKNGSHGTVKNSMRRHHHYHGYEVLIVQMTENENERAPLSF